MPPRRGVALFVANLSWERPLVLQSEGILFSPPRQGERRALSKRIWLLTLSVMVIFAAIACTSATSAPGAVSDDWGREIRLDKAPQRIVSHVPSITETLFALGLGDRVVGVSDYCDYPEEAKSKPKVGGYFNPNIEAIVALNPDLVLTDGYASDISKLEGLGIPFAVLQPKDIDGIFKDIELLGNITGSQQKASELTTDMKQRIDAISKKVAPISHGPRVFYVFDATDSTKPWTAGPGSFVDALINMAGGVNVAGQAQEPWIQFNMEELVKADPEILLVDSNMGTAVISTEQLKSLPGWKDLTAVKENRIYIVDGDLVNRSGPRIVEGLETIAAAIHPGLFAK